MERDDNVADLYDAANDEDRRYDEWRQEQDDEREQRLHDALEACRTAGVPDEHLKTLAFETGATRWALEVSIKRERTWFKDESF